MISKNKFKFQYEPNMNWEKFINSSIIGAICTCGIQTKKLQLIKQDSIHLILIPWTYEHNIWHKHKTNQFKFSLPKSTNITSEKDLITLMEKCVTIEWTNAEESYWEHHPSYQSILYYLQKEPKLETLDKLYYNYSINNNEITIICHEGWLNIPIIDNKLDINKSKLHYENLDKILDSLDGHINSLNKHFNLHLTSFNKWLDSLNRRLDSISEHIYLLFERIRRKLKL